MATYRVIFWKGIPSLVEAQDGDRAARVPLSQRFQDLIDAVAMRQGASETEAYLEGWQGGPAGDRPGSAEAVAEAVAAELEISFEEFLRKSLLAPSP
ncbi:MAG: virulence factor [Candidatus Rokubacteria bacterium]|nr:virulence factor [Candidatus Rokubacteria bacterium]